MLCRMAITMPGLCSSFADNSSQSAVITRNVIIHHPKGHKLPSAENHEERERTTIRNPLHLTSNVSLDTRS